MKCRVQLPLLHMFSFSLNNELRKLLAAKDKYTNKISKVYAFADVSLHLACMMSWLDYTD